MINNIAHKDKTLFIFGVIILLISSLGNYYTQFLLIPITLYYVYKPEYLMSLLFIAAINTGMFFLVQGISLFVFFFLIYVISFVLRKRKIKLKSAVIYLLFNLIVFMSAYNSTTGELSGYYTFLICTTMILLFYNEIINMSVLLELLYQCSKLFLIFITLLLLITFSIGEKNVIGYNVNPISYATVVCTIYCLGYNLIVLKKINLIYVFIGFIAIVFLGSRGSLFSGVIISAIIFMKSSNKNKFVIPILIITILPILGVVLSETVINRFNINDFIEGSASGRFILWEIVISSIIRNNNVLFGVGYGGDNIREIVREDYFGTDLDADCLYVDLFGQMGIFGIILFLLFLTSVIKFDKRYLLNNSLIFLSLLVGIGETMLDWNLFWYIIAFGFLNINSVKNNYTIMHTSTKQTVM